MESFRLPDQLHFLIFLFVKLSSNSLSVSEVVDRKLFWELSESRVRRMLRSLKHN